MAGITNGARAFRPTGASTALPISTTVVLTPLPGDRVVRVVAPTANTTMVYVNLTETTPVVFNAANKFPVPAACVDYFRIRKTTTGVQIVTDATSTAYASLGED